MPVRRKQLLLEQLEGRDMFAAFAVPWPEINSLRLSFIPDGTLVGDSQSDFFQTLEESAPNIDSQLAILQAFQTWAIETNSNIGIVSDNGQPIGTLGFKQGDVRFGDIRIGAFKMEQDVLAVANPYDAFLANTWVGDVFLNSASAFIANSDDPANALYSIMLHEAGHVYGIGHSQDPDSPMFPNFQGGSKALTSADIALLRTLYGSRQADDWEGSLGNDSFATATPVQLISSSASLVAPSWHGDIGSLDDVDTFMIEIPQAVSSIKVDLKASGISLLTAKLAVTNEAGEVIESSLATDPRTNDLSIKLAAIQTGERYFIRVESADNSVFGIGAYELKLTPISSQLNANVPIPVLFGFELPQLAPEELLVTTPGYVEHTYYEIQGALTSAKPSQVFRVQSPRLTEELDNVFTIVMAAETGSIADLGVSVTDAFGNLIPLTLIPGDNGKLELQVSDVVSGADYLITVFAEDASSVDMIYEIEVDFAQDGRLLETIVNNTLESSQTTLTTTYSVNKTGHHHFVLATSDWSEPNESGLRMRIIDSNGQTRSSTQLSDGHSTWIDLFLDQGAYTIEFTSPNRLPDATVMFQLSAETFSSPIGPQLRDASREPVESSAAAPLQALANHWLPGLAPTVETASPIPIISAMPHVRVAMRFASASTTKATNIDSYFAKASEGEDSALSSHIAEDAKADPSLVEFGSFRNKRTTEAKPKRVDKQQISEARREAASQLSVADNNEELSAISTPLSSESEDSKADSSPQASYYPGIAEDWWQRNDVDSRQFSDEDIELKDSNLIFTASIIYVGVTLTSNRIKLASGASQLLRFFSKRLNREQMK